MITRVQVKNFRSLADVDVTLGPLTVLVGRNGAGKSAFVDVLRFVRDALRHGLDDAIMERDGIASLRRWLPNRKLCDLEICLTVEEDSFWGEYAFVIGSRQDGEYFVKEEKCRIGKSRLSVDKDYELREGKWITPPPAPSGNPGRFEGKKVLPNELMLSQLGVTTPDFLGLKHWLASAHFYTIFPDALRPPQKPAHYYPLKEHGENLASALRELKKSEWFPDVLAALKGIAEDVRDIRVKEVGGFLVTELQYKQRNGDMPWFELAQESDGVVRVLGLLVGLYQDGPHVLTAIEEPEMTLYPGALGVIRDVLREAALRRQILITTQSPDLISRFEADELRVVERIDGVTQIGPIYEAQREAINRELFSAGDLLRIEGLHLAPVTVARDDDA